MEDGLVKISDFKPASFEDGRTRLTIHQSALLKLLKDKIHSAQPITREDILDFYLKNIKKTEGYAYHDQTYNRILQRWEYTGTTRFNLWKDEYNIKVQSMQWFKSNLGSVIIKGKILVVPIIEE